LSLIPTDNIVVKRYKEIDNEMKVIIASHFGEHWTPPTGAGGHLDEEDKTRILIGFGLRLSASDILKIVNESRKQKNQHSLEVSHMNYYKQKYGDLIDELYANAILRIGEIYKFSDKLYRIARFNELAEVLHHRLIDELEQGVDSVDETTLKRANLYIKVLEKINVEMGGTSVKDMIRRRKDREEDENDKNDVTNLSKQEISQIISQSIEDRYKGQLPPTIREKIEHSDYVNCANGEKMGEVVVCWNDKMTDNSPGSQCPVQMGKVKKCPKFLNQILLDDKNFLQVSREDGYNISFKQIAKLVGCTEYDVEIRDRVGFFLKKHDIVGRMGQMPKNDIPDIIVEDEDSEESE